jgi:hypothetical protein
VPDFDVDAFLAQPLVARVATVGPHVRPVWFLWEDRCFWWLTGSWSSLDKDLQRDPRAQLVVDTCDLETGEVLQVRASGDAEIVPFDAGRAFRKLSRYVGAERERWPERIRIGTFEDPSTGFARLAPTRLDARDLSLF